MGKGGARWGWAAGGHTRVKGHHSIHPLPLPPYRDARTRMVSIGPAAPPRLLVGRTRPTTCADFARLQRGQPGRCGWRDQRRTSTTSASSDLLRAQLTQSMAPTSRMLLVRLAGRSPGRQSETLNEPAPSQGDKEEAKTRQPPCNNHT